MESGKVTMKSLILIVLFTSLAITRTRSSLLGVELDEDGEEFLNEYLSLDEGRYLADLQEVREAAIEIDLISSRKHRGVLPQDPQILYQIGESEKDLPECRNSNEVCNKVDLYSKPWIERQCRCSDGRACPGSLRADDGHTIVDRTRQYKLCEPVKRLPICHYFKDVTWTLAPDGGIGNSTVQRSFCRCRPGSVPYLLKRKPHITAEGHPGFVYAFACSPQSRLKCQHKEPCRLFTVRKRRNSELEEVNVSPLCLCQKGHKCPKHHTDSGSLPARSYAGAPEVKTYSGYCVPTHHTEPVYTL